jgi:hypothetical protein
MRRLNSLVLPILLAAQSTTTLAADLNGGWTLDSSACDQIFAKQNNKLVFKPDADLHAGGLIVDGKKIIGTFQKCSVKSLHDDGSNVQVTAACSDGVAVSDTTFDVKISGENKLTLSSKAPVAMEMQYVRCPL